MRARGIATVSLLFTQGKVYVDRRTGVFSVSEPEESAARATFREDWSTITAVLRRAGAFLAALRTPGPDPFLRMPNVYGFDKCKVCGQPARVCQSCGGKIGGEEWLRCDLCALAVELALGAPADAHQLAGGGQQA